MPSIIDYAGRTHQLGCLGCGIRHIPEERFRGVVLRTEHFCVKQDFETPIPGFLIISPLRHVRSIDELTPRESEELLELTVAARRALRETLDATHVHIISNDTASHFHQWVLPRHKWMDTLFGRGLASIRPSVQYARDNYRTEEHLLEVERTLNKLRSHFSAQSLGEKC